MVDGPIDKHDEEHLIQCIHKYERSESGELICKKCGIPIPAPIPEPENEVKECDSVINAVKGFVAAEKG
ncbi:MAG: hypothetical protein JXA49_08810 [Actinobacteria bacterium]|nr:hypothetical protein [Actinomycetota bacterium]